MSQPSKEQVERLIAAIANLGYPVGMGLGPHPRDAEKIIRAALNEETE